LVEVVLMETKSIRMPGTKGMTVAEYVRQKRAGGDPMGGVLRILKQAYKAGHTPSGLGLSDAEYLHVLDPVSGGAAAFACKLARDGHLDRAQTALVLCKVGPIERILAFCPLSKEARQTLHDRFQTLRHPVQADIEAAIKLRQREPGVVSDEAALRLIGDLAYLFSADNRECEYNTNGHRAKLALGATISNFRELCETAQVLGS
jgi:hypothetical protein